jgi:tetratricopeptide (TPR) repeat protein
VSVCAQTIKNNYLLSVLSVDWELSIDLKGFTLEKNSLNTENNSRYLLATKKDIGMTVSVFIEKSERKGNYLDCRSFYWEKASKSPLPKENLKLYEEADIAFVEYDVESYQGNKIDFHSLNAYLSQGDYWIDVHISKTQYKANDTELFDAIVTSLKFEKVMIEDIPVAFLSASNAFYANDFPSAIIGYERIIQKLNINEMAWRVTVDNLGMSYGIIGDFNNAKRIFEYGMSLDPEYPLFYYNLACAYAEMSDLDSMLKNLEEAFKRKNNVIKGEKFPNPRKDSSFQKYLKNKQFEQLLKKYKM